MHDILRNTWLKNCPCDYKIFSGKSQWADEIGLPGVDDGPNGLTDKVRAAIHIAYAEEYDFLFRADNDTYVNVPRLLASDFTKRVLTNCYGGSGIWIHRSFMDDLLDSPTGGWGFYDDKWILDTYRKHYHCEPYTDARYSTVGVQPLRTNDIITCHFDQAASLRFGNRMVETHERWLHS